MAQHQDLKRKGGADPDHQVSRNHAPPPLSIKVPKMSDLPNTSIPLRDVRLPVDILLLTTEACELLACFAFLANSFRGYHMNLGYVYFGTMGKSKEKPLKVALMSCSGPGGSQTVIKNAVMLLRPKAAFSVGECMGLNPKHTKLGDVVVSSKLSTEQFTTPVRRNLGNLNLFSTEGWKPPLKDPVGEETVQVHRDIDIFSGSQFINKQSSMSQSCVTAVERKGEGLFAAARDMNIEWVIVKGISHFSDDSNTPDESWKSFASIMAVSLVSTMLHDPVVFKEWPHFEDLAAKTASSRRLPDSVSLEERQKQLRSLYETSSKVKIVPWDPNSAVDIDEIYTDLSWFMDHRTPTGVTQQQLDHYTEIFVRREPNPAPKRILVYGQPGIGKTVFTKKATFDWSRQRYSKTLGTFDLALLVRLCDVSGLPDIASIVGASEVLDSDHGATSVYNLYNYVLGHQEKVLLILDGFDEYVYTSRHESPVFQIWKKSQLRDCCVIITSGEMKDETLISFSDALFKIDGFNDERQEEFARRFLKDDGDVEEFLKYLEKHDLRKLAQIPLLLLVLCLLWTKTTREELPKERADIFALFIQTLFDHVCEKQSAESVSAKDYSDELYALGSLAFEALLQCQLCFPVSQLRADWSFLDKLIGVGLLQVLNMTSLKPEKGVYFIHKSVQEYLAGNFLKEELTSRKAESTNSLLKLDSVEKISVVAEVLKFACELSEEAASKIRSHLKMVTKEETSLVSISNLIEKLKRKTIKDDEDITKDKRDNNEEFVDETETNGDDAEGQDVTEEESGGIVTSEGIQHWPIKRLGVHVMFPPNAVSEPTSIVVHKCKHNVRSPPLQEHEAITSNVIALSAMARQGLKFNTKVKLSLSHSGTDLRGYELVIKKQIDKETNIWEEVGGTIDVRCCEDIEGNYPSHMKIPDLFFPVAQADITECSTYAVVCRLKSSPTYIITSSGGSFSHPDYPGVTVIIPENAVAPTEKFPVELKVQEVSDEEFEGRSIIIGPVLRINRAVQFLRPVTIQLPISLRGQEVLNPDPTVYRVRVLFLKTEDKMKKWIEITGDLPEPPSFDGKFVRFQVDRFCRYSPFLDKLCETSSAVGLGITRVLSRFTWNQPKPATFVAYFCRDFPSVLYLICCPPHLKGKVLGGLEDKGITPYDGNSKKHMIPGEDMAFVSVSEGIRPFKKKDMEKVVLKLEDSAFKTELRVLPNRNKDIAVVEFWTTLESTGRKFSLCQIHLNLSLNLSTQGIDRTDLGTLRLPSTVSWLGEAKKGIPTDDELEDLSVEIPDHWKTLGRRLTFDNAELEAFDKDNDKIADKAYAMLIAWKQREGLAATYRVLNKALCDIRVRRRDLAQRFCCN